MSWQFFIVEHDGVEVWTGFCCCYRHVLQRARLAAGNPAFQGAVWGPLGEAHPRRMKLAN